MGRHRRTHSRLIPSGRSAGSAEEPTDGPSITPNERNEMKIVVIGGTGLIGSKLVAKLEEQGHDAVPASPNSGVNTLTGEGLSEVLERAQLGRRRGDALLPDVISQPPRGRGGSGRGTSRRAVGRRHRPPDRERLLPREARAGGADRGLLDPVLDRPR